MKRNFFIDIENVWYNGLISIEKAVTQEDKVIIFHAYTHGETLPERILYQIEKKAGLYETVPLYSHTHNALDFQLCAYLGMLIGERGTGEEYYIVSEDKGYQAAIEFIKRKAPGIRIHQISCMKDMADAIDVLAEVKSLLPDYPKKVVSEVYTGMYETDNLKDFHNYINKRLTTHGEEVYPIVKELFMRVHQITQKKHENKGKETLETK